MNKLIIVRACSGAGKSTLAKKLQKEIPDSVMVSADDFFEYNDTYNYRGELISIAHKYCVGQVFYNLIRGHTVIVHNTFVETWQLEEYIQTAFKLKIPWEITEPNTKWKNDLDELEKKNVHRVPRTTIEKMLNNWVPTKELTKHFQKYEVV